MDEVPVSNVRRQHYKLCQCFAMDCRAKKWEDPEDDTGAIQSGKWIHKTTHRTHAAKDEELRQAGKLPALRADRDVEMPVVDVATEASGSQTDPPLIAHMQGEDAPGPGTMLRQYLITIVATLVSWLHLKCGLSRDNASRTLKVLGAIIDLVTSSQDNRADYRVPADVRTAMKHLSIEPQLDRSICCPVCFRSYSLEDMPSECLAMDGRTRCQTPLWVERKTRGGPKVVPRRLYTTQNLKGWLEHFLGRPGMEARLRQSTQHIPDPSGRMRSIWDSPAWQSLGDFTSQPNNLVFSYYIDWFNPFLNKIAGKKASCGAIMAVPLNLPYEMWHLSENAFFAGITPPPKEPTVETITALADPVVRQFADMWNGVTLKTYEHPKGAVYRIAILPGIGDLLGLAKAMGCAGHASNNSDISLAYLRICSALPASHLKTDVGLKTMYFQW